MSKHIIVVGGGMAGAAAAHSLRGQGYRVTILEKNDRLGGRIKSEKVDGVAIEMGAGFMTNGYTNILSFLAEVGLDNRLYRQRGSSGVLRGGKVKMATISTLAGNGALSWSAKLKTVPLFFKTVVGWRKLDMRAPWRAEKYDTQSVAEAFQDKAARELLEYVAQPVLNGYFYWTAERTSFAMLLIILKAMLKGGTQKLAGGLQQMPEKAARGCNILLDHEVSSIQKNTDGTFTVKARHQNQLRELHADGIMCATTASVVSRIIPRLTTKQKDFFASIGYSSTAVVAQVYPIDQTLGDKGLAFPRSENGKIAAITVSPEKTMRGKTLGSVKVYASGFSQQHPNMPDKDTRQQLLNEKEPFNSAVLVAGARPIATYFQKWPEALPIFDHGHFHKLRLFADGKIEEPNSKLVFAGDYLGGPFMEGAFTSGIQAAARLHAQLEPCPAN